MYGDKLNQNQLLMELTVPLHPGAEKYFKEIGIIK